MKKLSIFLLLVAAGINSCKRVEENQSRPASTSALVLFKIGSIQVAGRELSAGEILKNRETITVGPQSIADLQIREGESSITLRLQQNSILTLGAVQEKNGLVISPKLSQGSILAQVQKLAPNENLRVRLPSAVAAVRGTKFEAQVEEDGSSRVAVYDGKVAVRPRSAAVEDLPPSLISKSEELTQVVGALEKSETIVETGKTTKVDVKSSSQILDKSGLSGVLSKQEVQALAGKENPTEQEITAAQTAIQSSYEDPAKKEQLKSATEKPVAAPPVEEIPKQDIQRKLKEYEEFLAIEQSKTKDADTAQKAVQARSAEQREQRIQRIEQIIQKSAETLILSNGSRVRGVIFQQGMDYMVLTPECKQFYPAAAVSGVEF